MRIIEWLSQYNLNIKSPKHLGVLSLLLIGALVYSFNIGQKIGIMSDFAVFWNAGNNFKNGVSLYSGIGGACRYIYPPFAAMCFQGLALFEIHTSATIFSLVNIGFWLLIIYYSYNLLALFNTNKVQLYTSLLIGTLLSLRFFLYHFMFVQMNELVLLLSLGSIYYFLKGRIIYSIPLVIIAISIKIIPVFILIWILSKRLNFQTLILTFLCFTIAILLPFIQRGTSQALLDLQEYYISFLEPFQNGAVEPKLQNYGLSAALYKAFSVTQDGMKYQYMITLLSPASIALINKILLLGLLAMYGGLLLLSQFVFKSISLYEIVFILLFTHLVSGITWEYHLVSLLFVYAALSLKYITENKNKIFWILLLLFALFNALMGADTVGFYLYYKACGLSILTWFMLGLTILSFVFFVMDKNRKNSLVPN